MSSNCFRAKLFSPPSWPAMHVQNVDPTWVLNRANQCSQTDWEVPVVMYALA